MYASSNLKLLGLVLYIWADRVPLEAQIYLENNWTNSWPVISALHFHNSPIAKTQRRKLAMSHDTISHGTSFIQWVLSSNQLDPCKIMKWRLSRGGTRDVGPTNHEWRMEEPESCENLGNMAWLTLVVNILSSWVCFSPPSFFNARLFSKRMLPTTCT